MFKQLITWLFGLITVQLHLLEYPIREFAYATRASFAFEYFIYPATCVIFTLRFPENKTVWHKIGWYLFWPSWMTALEVLIEKYTSLIHYIHWAWYWTWITLLITLWIPRQYYKWFMKKKIVPTNP